MTLDIALAYDSITSDRLTGTIKDNTVYGGSNPVRSVLLLNMTGYKMKYDATVDQSLTVTGNTGNPLTDSQWTFNVPKDGWFRFLFVVVQAYSSGTTYAQYDAVYNSSTKVTYRSLQNGNIGQSLSNTSYWEVISDPSSLANNKGETNESLNINSDIYEIIISANAEYSFANQISITSDEGGDAAREQNVTLYELLGVLVDGEYIRSDRNQFSQGERLARRIQTITTEAGLL